MKTTVEAMVRDLDAVLNKHLRVMTQGQLIEVTHAAYQWQKTVLDSIEDELKRRLESGICGIDGCMNRATEPDPVTAGEMCCADHADLSEEN